MLLLIGTIVYAATVLLLLGRGWLATLFKDVGTAADAPPSKTPQPPDPTSASAALPDNTPPPTRLEAQRARPEVDQLDVGDVDRAAQEDRSHPRKPLRRVGGEEAHG